MRLFLFLILLTAGSAFGQDKKIIYFGGGGDPPGPTTIFDGSFQKFTGFAQSRDWNETVYFDGSHKKSQALARRMLGETPSTFSAKNYDKQIDKTLADLQDGKIKSGDQLMIILDTHGDRQDQNLIHTVEAQDQPVSVDKLIRLKELAETKGVKLAILDTSCFGGNSMKLAGPHTCVVSLSLPHRMANSEDTEALAAALNNPRYHTLEEAFLAGRKKSAGDAQPQISSPAGLMVQDILQELDKGLYEYEDLDTEIGETKYCRDMEPSAEGLQRMNEKIREFQKLIHSQAMQGLSATERERLQSLKEKYAKSVQVRAPLEKFLTFESTQKICGQDKSYCLTVAEIDEQKKMNEDELKSHPGDSDDKDALRDIARMQKNPVYLHWKRDKKKLQKNIDELEGLVSDIAEDERALYDELYTQAALKASEPNPCRDFKL
jgi:hypothetical protein